jgi:murein DD-endopeptidase MepM/ murein hydrolase activator NlpD
VFVLCRQWPRPRAEWPSLRRRFWAQFSPGADSESRQLLALLETRKHLILSRISAVHPFAFCPVDGPHAVTNNFGVWVHRPKKWGGNHIHKGNDIMSPEGTPIVAPFDGMATDATNHIGGIAVTVYGQFGCTTRISPAWASSAG